MGNNDLHRIHPIYRECVEFCKENNLPFHFREDLGNFETSIEFTAIGYHHPPKSKNWDECKKNGNEIKCPDLLDFENRIIIEMDEEPKPGKKMGKLGKKGHSDESEKDSHRDMLYRISGFRFLKIWESEKNWKDLLHKFLLECNNNKL